MVILKSFYELLKDKDIPTEDAAETRGEVLREQERKLTKEGWRLSIGEGGIVSPDGSTVLYLTKSPYHGQLFQLSREGEQEFEHIKDEFIRSGDFIEV